MSIESVAASTVTTDALVEAWNAAYAGSFVDVSRDVPGLRAHVEAGSIDLGTSVVLRDGGRPIALSLLGARPVDTSDAAAGERGWIGGFGVAPSHRGPVLAGGHRAQWGREPAHLGLDADVVALSTGPGSGTVPQAGDEADGILLLHPVPERVAVPAAAARDDRAAHRLARALAREYAGATCRVVNEPEGSPLVAALGAVGVVEELAQHEMRVELSPANAST
jgi:hypothetical protein